ncbi:MAG: cytochrome c biogenesis protein ResB [Planctomycetota bacterium]
MADKILRAAGSLWFAAVLLILLLFAMACATVFEAAHADTNGTERALALFYTSKWFELLMGLLAINIGSALILRYPFSKRQIGFVITHISILTILAGAWITKVKGIEGQLSIAEGETLNSFQVSLNSFRSSLQETIIISNRADQSLSTVDFKLPDRGTVVLEKPKVPKVNLDNMSVEVKRYWPDSTAKREVLNDGPDPRSAIEVSFSASGTDSPAWVFAGQTEFANIVQVTYQQVGNKQQLDRLISPTPTTQPVSEGMVKIKHKDSTYEIPLPDCLNKTAPIGDTGYTINVLRYLPHAFVNADKKLVNAPDQRDNPAIEAQLTGPDTSQKRYAFARFPDLGSFHGKGLAKEFKLTFEMKSRNMPETPVEVLGGPNNELYVRFRDGVKTSSKPLSIGTPVETPWPGHKFSVLRRYDHARSKRSVIPIDPPRTTRIPAVLLKVSAPQHNQEIRLQKYHTHPVTIDQKTYQLTYKNKTIPLGFSLTLDRFRVGYYAGGKNPRSFESQVTITDPTTGRQQSRVISMNHPTSYAGYTFYQWKYSKDNKRPVSYLSVSRDPGKPMVFAGFIATMAGMFLILVTRGMRQRKKSETVDSLSTGRP